MPRSQLNLPKSMLSLAAALALLLAWPAGAGTMTLADLMGEDFSMVSGNVLFSDFEIKIKGKGLDLDPEAHLVSFSDGELQIELAAVSNGKKGNVKIDYVASSASGGGLVGAGLDVDGNDYKVMNKLKGDKNLGKLAFRGARPDKAVLQIDFAAVETIRVRSKIIGRGSGSVQNSFNSTGATVPEPASAAMLALGLTGLAIGGRKRN